MTDVTRSKTEQGEVIRFKAGPLPVPQIEWVGKGAFPSIGFTAGGAHVLRLTDALNLWWQGSKAA